MNAATILVVEDHAESLDYLASLLRYHDYTVLEARNASEGIALAQSGQPSLIITDVLMPDCDGYEFTRRLREHDATAGIPVIFWTASYGRRGAAILLAENFGVECVLSKPTEPEEVVSAVQKALRTATRDRRPLSPDLRQDHTRLLTNHILRQVDELDDIGRLDHLRQHFGERLTTLHRVLHRTASALQSVGDVPAGVPSDLAMGMRVVDEMTATLRRLDEGAQ